MDELNWVSRYQSLILAGQTEQAKELKLNFAPKSLYRFMRLNDYTLNSLEERSFWLATIDSLNDPYESSLIVRPGDFFRMLFVRKYADSVQRDFGIKLSPAEHDQVIESEEPFITFCRIMKTHGYTVHSTEAQLYNGREEYWNDAWQNAGKEVRICSLSEKLDSTLMWSHYADQHRGICVEYDITSYRHFEHLEPVLYSNKLFIGKPHIKAMINQTLAASIKSKDWEYEKEWRLLTINPNTDKVDSPSPITVFLGSRFEINDNSRKKALLKILENSGIVIKQMKLHKTEYRMSHSP